MSPDAVKDISIIMCTNRRPGAVAPGLRSLSLVTFPENLDWEFILANNGNPNLTPQMELTARKFLGDRARCISEPKRGAAKARNLAIRSASGKILVFCDDDLSYDQEWLATVYRVFAGNDTDVL
ncbi:glycosyltransferase family 2 protein, partial [bacterium]